MGLKQRTCPECGKVFDLGTFGTSKVYCSDECRERNYKRNGPWAQPEITFNCDYCGKEVIVNGRDRRSRYCSLKCQQRYSAFKQKTKRQEHAKLETIEWVSLDGEKIRGIVNANGWSLSSVSWSMGKSNGYLSTAVRDAARNASIKKDKAEKIAGALGVELDEIIKATDAL